MALGPEGYTILADAVLRELPKVACHLPGAAALEGEAAAEVAAHVEQLLRVRADRVHFLDFWAAFTKASRLVAGMGGTAGYEEGLGLELETVRDSILRHLDGGGGAADSAGAAPGPLKPTDVLEVLRTAVGMSEAPEFWRLTSMRLERQGLAEVSLEVLSALMMSWLQEAIAWQHAGEAAVVPEDGGAVHCFVMPWAGRSGKQAKERKPRLPVLLHIYDVSQEDQVQKLNRVLAHKRSPIKFGGVFHAGVEVNGLEWSFGMTCSDTACGVSCHEPRSHPMHTYRQTVALRPTKLSAEEVADLISLLIEEYPGDDYCLLRRNCCHFADDFCQRLGAGGLPGWVYRLARIGALVDGTMHRVLNRRLLPESADDEELEEEY